MDKPPTPFARLLRDYMWAQRPPLNPSRLARHLSVSQQTVSNWFNAGTVPLPKMLAHISDKTGIPLRQLFEVAGYPLPNSGLWDYIIEGLRADPTITEETREAMISRITEMRERYEAEGGGHLSALIVQ